MWVSQAEITAAYLQGTDISAVYRRRVVQAYALVGAVLAGPAFFLLYYIKSALGINLFDFHLWDLL